MRAEWTAHSRPGGARRFLARWLSIVLLLVGGTLLGFVAGSLGRDYYAARQAPDADAALVAHQDAVPGTLPLLASEPRQSGHDLVGSTPHRLVIPSVGIDAQVDTVGTVRVNGELAWEVPNFTVGYYEPTALPGSAGNAVMAGHVDPINGRGAVFHHLPDIQVGAAIDVMTADGRTLRYVVDETMVVEPTDVWVMDPTEDPILTLITCVPSGVYTHRFIVRASLVDDGLAVRDLSSEVSSIALAP